MSTLALLGAAGFGLYALTRRGRKTKKKPTSDSNLLARYAQAMNCVSEPSYLFALGQELQRAGYTERARAIIALATQMQNDPQARANRDKAIVESGRCDSPAKPVELLALYEIVWRCSNDPQEMFSLGRQLSQAGYPNQANALINEANLILNDPAAAARRREFTRNACTA